MLANDAEEAAIKAAKELVEALRAHHYREHPDYPIVDLVAGMEKAVGDERRHEQRDDVLRYLQDERPATVARSFPNRAGINEAAARLRDAMTQLQSQLPRRSSEATTPSAAAPRVGPRSVFPPHLYSPLPMHAGNGEDAQGAYTVYVVAPSQYELGSPPPRAEKRYAGSQVVTLGSVSADGDWRADAMALARQHDIQLAKEAEAQRSSEGKAQPLPEPSEQQRTFLLGVYVKAQGGGIHVSVDDAARAVGMDPDEALAVAQDLARAEIRPHVRWLLFKTEDPVVVDNEGGHIALTRSARRWCADRWGPPEEAAKEAERRRRGAKPPSETTTERVPSHTFLEYAPPDAPTQPPADSTAPGGDAAPLSDGSTEALREPAAATGDAAPASLSGATPGGVGARYGKYEVVAKLGAGGMGQVVKARDSALDRLVALKFLLKPNERRSDDVERQEREARALAKLAHPGVATVHDFVKQGEDRFIVMEYVEGKPLTAVNKDRVALLTRLGRDVALAVQAMHEVGVVHRDLKPDNVLVTCHDDDGAAALKVVDLGLAKLADDDRGLTSDGVVIGSPSYMAPEQARGEPADGRADVWAVGATLYRCLTGGPAFPGVSPLQTLERVRTAAPAPIRAANPLVSEALERVVMRCLEKRPEDRFPTAGALAEALAGCLGAAAALNERPAGSPIPNPPGSDAEWQRAIELLTGPHGRQIRAGADLVATLVTRGARPPEPVVQRLRQVWDSPHAPVTLRLRCLGVLRHLPGALDPTTLARKWLTTPEMAPELSVGISSHFRDGPADEFAVLLAFASDWRVNLAHADAQRVRNLVTTFVQRLRPGAEDGTAWLDAMRHVADATAQHPDPRVVEAARELLRLIDEGG